MLASSTPCKLSLCADRMHACAGDSHTSNGIVVACPTTQSVLAIVPLYELHGDSWPSSSTDTSSFCCNHQYSVTAVTTSTGTIAERYAYSAYGQPTILDASASVLSNSAINNRYTYTGREWDATLGLHHFRARWMSPNAGRFLGRDPIGYIRDLDNSKRYIDLLVTRGLVDFRLNIFEFLNSKSLDSLDPHGAMTIWPPWLNPFKWWGGYKACEDVSNLYDCAYYQPIWNNYKEECEDEMNQDYIVFMLTSERDCPHQLYPIFGPRSTEQAVFCCMFKKAKAAGLDVKKFANSATACIAGIRLPFTITSLLIPALE